MSEQDNDLQILQLLQQGSGTQKLTKRSIKDLHSSKGEAIGMALADLKKLKGKVVTSSLNYGESFLSKILKGLEKFAPESNYMKVNVNLYEGSVEDAQKYVSFMRQALIQLKDTKYNIILSSKYLFYKDEFEAKWTAEQKEFSKLSK